MIPDSLPILTSGLGNAAAGTACAMSAVHFLEGGAGDSDMPECVHPVLARVFVRVNDAPIWDDDEHRTRTLWPLIARAMNTRPVGTDVERQVLSTRLAVWSARQVLPLVRAVDREVCERAIDAAQKWCDDPTEQNAAAAYAAANDAITAAYAAYAANAAAYAAAAAANAANAAAYAAAYAATAAANAAAYAATATADAVTAAAYAAANDAADPAYTAFLIGLLDEYDRLTGHTAQPVDITPLASKVRCMSS